MESIYSSFLRKSAVNSAGKAQSRCSVTLSSESIKHLETFGKRGCRLFGVHIHLPPKSGGILAPKWVNCGRETEIICWATQLQNLCSCESNILGNLPLDWVDCRCGSKARRVLHSCNSVHINSAIGLYNWRLPFGLAAVWAVDIWLRP